MPRYRRGCRCLACRIARQAYRRPPSAGARIVTNDADLRLVIRRLRDSGLGIRRIAALAGVHKKTIYRIIQQRTPRIRVSVADRIRQIPAGDKAPCAVVSSWRSRRLIEALLAEGYTKRDILRAWRAVTGTRYTRVLRCGVRVRVSTETVLRRVHDRLTS